MRLNFLCQMLSTLKALTTSRSQVWPFSASLKTKLANFEKVLHFSFFDTTLIDTPLYCHIRHQFFVSCILRRHIW
jgi:hypothetical protein